MNPMTAGEERRHRFMRNTLSSSVGQLVTMAIAVVSTLITARWLGADGRGVLALVSMAATTAAVLGSFGAYSALTTFLARGELSVGSARHISIVVSAGIGLLTAAVLAVARPFSPEMWSWAPFVAVGAFVVAAGFSQIAVASGVGRVDLGVANTVTTAFALLIGYSIAWFTVDSPVAASAIAVGVWIVGQGLGNIVGWVSLRGVAAAEERHPWSRTEFSRYAVTAYPASIIGQLAARADVLLLGLLAPVAVVGVYSTAVVAATVLFVLPSAVAAALARPLGEGGGDVGRTVRIGAVGALLGSAAVVPPVVAVLALIARPLLGDAFADLAWIVVILAPGMVLFAPAYPASTYYGTALKRPSLGTGIAAIALVLDIALLVVLAPAWGARGAAVASSAGYAVAGVVNLALLWRLSRGESRFGILDVFAYLSDAVRRLVPAR